MSTNKDGGKVSLLQIFRDIQWQEVEENSSTIQSIIHPAIGASSKCSAPPCTASRDVCTCSIDEGTSFYDPTVTGFD